MFRTFALTLYLFISSWAVAAQECNPPYEMVTRLFKPEPGAYTLWDSVYDEPSFDEVFKTALHLNDGSVLAVGQRYSLLTGLTEIIFITFDRLGRKVDEKFFSLPDVQDVIKIKKRTGQGYVLLTNILTDGQSKAWIGFFDEDLNFKSKQVLEDKQHDILATDIVSSVNSGWVISASQRRSYGQGEDQVKFENARLYLLDQSGRKIQERSYNPGGNNHISSLTVLKKGGAAAGYIATGYFINKSNKNIAWALRLDGDLSLNWQSEYSRGLLAKLKVSYSFLDQFILVYGDVLPSNGKPIGTWLALLDADDGRVIWQRYFYGESEEHEHLASGLFVNEDNRINLMMSVRSLSSLSKQDVSEERLETDFIDYAHLLSLSPRGILLGGDTYFYAQGASIEQLLKGNEDERIMVGHVLKKNIVQEKDFQQEESNQDLLQENGRIFLPEAELSQKAKKGLEMLQKKLTYQEALQAKKLAKQQEGLRKMGWVVIGDKLDTYTDPCLR